MFLSLGLPVVFSCLDSGYALSVGILQIYSQRVLARKHLLLICPIIGGEISGHLIKVVSASFSTVKLLFFPL